MRSSMFSKLCAASLFLCGCTSVSHFNNSTVSHLDTERFLGNWYEIARFNHRFERGMTHCTATYSLQKDGSIRVENQGRKNGNLKKSVGRAKLTTTPGLLRVSFFQPIYSDYRILMLADDYSYALVGSSSMNFLWILSRTPHLLESTKEKILAEATRRGYDISALIWVKQD